MHTAVHQPFGDYILTDLLGEGGMGSVYRAEHGGTGQQVAIKIIAPHLARTSQVAKRFEAEARAVMRIDHPNVIRIFDYGFHDDGTLYHVMELLHGVELTKVMERHGPFSAWDALPYVQEICRGLQAAHDRAVVHRDLKPENIFVLSENPVAIKMLDFGIAKLLDPAEFVNLTATGVAIGTPMFIAPEQAMGDKSMISPQTDIYSFGVILYAMLCGSPPFESPGVGGLLAMHINNAPPPLRQREPSIPEAVAALVHACLEKDPRRRPQSANVLAAAYQDALDASYYGMGAQLADDQLPPTTLDDDQLPPTTLDQAALGPQPTMMEEELPPTTFAVRSLGPSELDEDEEPTRQSQPLGIPRPAMLPDEEPTRRSQPLGLPRMDAKQPPAPYGQAPAALARAPMGRLEATIPDVGQVDSDQQPYPQSVPAAPSLAPRLSTAETAPGPQRHATWLAVSLGAAGLLLIIALVVLIVHLIGR